MLLDKLRFNYYNVFVKIKMVNKFVIEFYYELFDFMIVSIVKFMKIVNSK